MTPDELIDIVTEPSVRYPPAAIRLRAGIISLVVSGLVFAAKFAAWQITSSTAVLSDALESIINVIAAAFALASLAFANVPADESHPYGHGKIEFLSGSFEGGMIALAALIIIYQAAIALWLGQPLFAIQEGIVLIAGTGVVNAVLGWFLLSTGRRIHSPALEADGLHVLTDFWTSLGVIIGLGLVGLTGWQAIDAIVALVLGVNLSIVGLRLLRRSLGGLLDESDPELLEVLAKAGNDVRTPGIISIHRLRAIRSGGILNIDAQLVVPRFWSIMHGHEAGVAFEEEILRLIDQDGRFTFHIDPCRPTYCTGCSVVDCPVREHELHKQRAWTIDEMTGDPPP